MNRMKQAKFDVRIGPTLLTIVYGDADLTAADMRRSLLNHDGLPARISVYRWSLDGRYAYDSVSRASKPEEH